MEDAEEPGLILALHAVYVRGGENVLLTYLYSELPQNLVTIKWP